MHMMPDTYHATYLLPFLVREHVCVRRKRTASHRRLVDCRATNATKS